MADELVDELVEDALRRSFLSSACCNCGGGALVDHPRQQRCSNTNRVSQPRALRSALG